MTGQENNHAFDHRFHSYGTLRPFQLESLQSYSTSENCTYLPTAALWKTLFGVRAGIKSERSVANEDSCKTAEVTARTAHN